MVIFFRNMSGSLLKSFYGDNSVKSEFIYGKDKRRFIDWYIIKKNKIYLFEIKANQFHLQNNQVASKRKL